MFGSMYIFYCLYFLEDINHFDNNIRNLYTKSNYLVDDQSWPPFTPKKFVSLLLIRHLEKQLDKQVPTITGSMEIAENLKVNNKNSFTTNKISEIFQHGENVEAHNKTILILGVPGIGKTILSKEIAYQWADNKLLSEEETVLMLFLRDPNVKKIKDLKDFVHYFYGFSENAINLSTRYSDYIFQSGGSNVTIILDGLDEIPNEVIDNTYIKLLLERRALPCCRIVVTSRPVESIKFQTMIDTEVEIFGFTQKNISDFVRNELEDQKQGKLMDYFKQNENLYHLCYIPFILFVLVCIAKEYDELPGNRVELYKNFVVFTISRFLKRFEGPNYTVSTIDKLSVKYKSYLLELSKYAFNALEINQVVFTRKDVPKLKNAPETWYGLGLLNSVKYFKIAENSDRVSYNFLHKSIQEFLAAYYITTLNTNKQLKLLKKYFYLNKYLNTWIMYIGLSQNPFPLKHFLSRSKLRIATKVLKFANISTQSKIQRLYLFYCFSELKDSSLYDLICSFFQYGNLDLSYHTLSLKDIDTLVCILDRSSVTQWTQLNLSHCNIGDSGFHHLSIAVSNLNIELTLDTIDLSDNQLTIDSVKWVANFVHLCKTRVLYLSGNSMLDSDTKVVSFAMNYANISNFALSVSYHHHEYIIYNGTDNSFLLNLSNKTDQIHGLFIFNYQFLEDNGAIEMLSSVIMKQGLLTLLVLWNCGLSKINIHSDISDIMKKTDDKVHFVYEKAYDDSTTVLLEESFQATSVFTFVLFSVTVLIFKNLQIEFFLSCVVPNLTCDQLNYVALSNCHFNSNTTQYFAAFICECHFLSKIVLYNNHLDVDMLIQLLNILITIKSLKDIFVYESSIPTIIYEGFVQRFADSKVALLLVNMSCVVALRTNEQQLTEIYGTYDSFCQISWISLNQCIINVKVADWIFKMISSCVCFQGIYMKDCIIETDSAITKMFTVLKNINSLTTLSLDNNKIPEAESEELAVAIIVNNSLETVHLNNNHLGSSITSIANALQSLSSLKKLSLNANHCKCENVASSIACVIANNTFIEQLSLKNNFLHPGDMMLICNSLSNVFYLRVINFKQNNITEEDAVGLECVISHNAGLEELYLGCNFLKLGGIKVAKGLQKISSVKVLDLEKNNLSKEVAEDLAAAVSVNKSLEKLWLNDNCFMHSTVLILEGLKEISTLKVLDLNNNKDRSTKIPAAITYVITENKLLERLSLSDNNLNDDGIIKIAQSLYKHSKLKNINLQYNNITEEAAEALASIISSNTGLEELYLGNNQLKLGVTKISTALKNISSLIVLDLDNNNIPEEVADELSAAIRANNSLEKLWLSDNHLGSSTVKIVNALKEILTLKEINLNGNNRSEELAPALTSIITKSKLIERILLSDNNLNDDGVIKIAHSLCKHSKLKYINLQSNNITEKGAEALASIISSNTGLEALYLGNNQLQLGVIKISTALRNISSIKVLDLDNNNIPEEVADELSAAIRANTSLEKLWLDDNHLGSSTVMIMNAIKEILTLKEICLNGNQNRSEELAPALTSIIRKSKLIERLTLRDNNLNDDGVIRIAHSLCRHSKLKYIDLQSNNITEKAAEALACIISSNTGLEKLYLGNNQLQLGVIKLSTALKNISSLKVLDLDNNNIHEQAADELSSVIDNNLSLKKILLSNNLLENGLIQVVESHRRLANLKILELSHNCISPTQVANLASIVSECTALKVLSLGGICFSVGEILYFNVYRIRNHFHKNISNTLTQGIFFDKNLYELTRMKICQLSLLNYNLLSITYQDWYFYISYQYNDQVMGKNTDYDLIIQEAKQKLSQIDSKAVISSLQIIRTLKAINLENNNIDEDAATELAGHLHCNNILEQLWLRGNELHDKGASVILQSLYNLSTLLILDLSFNHLSNQSADGIAVVIGNNCLLQQLWLDGNDLLTRGVVRIASTLKKLSSLRILSLCSNGITDYAAEEISNVITSNALLVDLLLGNNQLQATGICKIAVAMKKTLLIKLDLSNNHLTPDAVEELAVTLSNCTNLQQLFLNDNMLGTEGTIKIANALKSVNSLQVLTLSNNNITESAVDALVDVLKHNIYLKIALIGGNDLQTTGVNLIVQTTKNITTLQLLDVSDNNVSEDEKENFRMIFANYNNFTIVV